MYLPLHDAFKFDNTEIQIVIGSDFRHVLIPFFFSRTAEINTIAEVLSSCLILYKLVKLAPLQLEETPRVPVVSFPSFTRGRFTGDAQLKMRPRNGVL